MGLEKYGYFVQRAKDTLTYDPGWSEENPTGSWRTERPVLDEVKCTHCDLCWLYCPDGCITPEIAFHLEHCKGCGICAEECPRKAIAMVNEEGR